MKLHEYINEAKEELDAMYLKWLEENAKDPDNWPMEMDEAEWGEQELLLRFP